MNANQSKVFFYQNMKIFQMDMKHLINFQKENRDIKLPKIKLKMLFKVFQN